MNCCRCQNARGDDLCAKCADELRAIRESQRTGESAPSPPAALVNMIKQPHYRKPIHRSEA